MGWHNTRITFQKSPKTIQGYIILECLTKGIVNALVTLAHTNSRTFHTQTKYLDTLTWSFQRTQSRARDKRRVREGWCHICAAGCVCRVWFPACVRRSARHTGRGARAGYATGCSPAERAPARSVREHVRTWNTTYNTLHQPRMVDQRSTKPTGQIR